jgi:hypothetical protein
MLLDKLIYRTNSSSQKPMPADITEKKILESFIAVRAHRHISNLPRNNEPAGLANSEKPKRGVYIRQ